MSIFLFDRLIRRSIGKSFFGFRIVGHEVQKWILGTTHDFLDGSRTDAGCR
jgi:hypothetical protein